MSSHILEPDKSGQIGYTGLIFSPDGTRIYLSNVNGDIKVFQVSADGKVAGLFSIPLRLRRMLHAAGGNPGRFGRYPRWASLVCGLEPVEPPGGNRYHDRESPAGVARGCGALGVVLVGDKAYVSNWGVVSRTRAVPPGRPGRARGSGSIRCGISPTKARFP